MPRKKLNPAVTSVALSVLCPLCKVHQAAALVVHTAILLLFMARLAEHDLFEPLCQNLLQPPTHHGVIVG